MQWQNGRDIQGSQNVRICPQQVCILYVYMHTYKLTVLRVELTVWTVSSAAHLTPQLRVTAHHRRQTQSHKLFKTVNQHLYNVIILQIITGGKNYIEDTEKNLFHLYAVHSPLLITGHFLHRITILVLIVFPACWIARLPSLYTLIIETVACILPPLITAVITVPVITVVNTKSR